MWRAETHLLIFRFRPMPIASDATRMSYPELWRMTDRNVRARLDDAASIFALWVRDGC
jgi:hypothetical protein